MRLLVVLVLGLALAASEAAANTLYRWVTPDGRVEIGTNPPPGVRAEPWLPGTPASAPPTAPAVPAAPARTQAPGLVPAARAPQRQPTVDCRAKLSELSTEISQTETRIAGLEQQLETLSESLVAFQQNTCTRDTSRDPTVKPCRSSSYSRDAEIARTERELASAQEKLADLETRARDSDCPSEEQ